MLGHCWATVYDAGPTMTQHWFNAYRSLHVIQTMPRVHPDNVLCSLLSLQVISYTSTKYDALIKNVLCKIRHSMVKKRGKACPVRYQPPPPPQSIHCLI